jgi:hypothetical protein
VKTNEKDVWEILGRLCGCTLVGKQGFFKTHAAVMGRSLQQQLRIQQLDVSVLRIMTVI